MYIVSKTFCVDKAHLDKFLSRFSNTSPILEFDGFVKREIAVQSTKETFDFVRFEIYFVDKNAYYRWEGSPVHIAMHQQKKEKPEGLISVEKKQYHLYQLDER